MGPWACVCWCDCSRRLSRLHGPMFIAHAVEGKQQKLMGDSCRYLAIYMGSIRSSEPVARRQDVQDLQYCHHCHRHCVSQLRTSSCMKTPCSSRGSFLLGTCRSTGFMLLRAILDRTTSDGQLPDGGALVVQSFILPCLL